MEMFYFIYLSEWEFFLFFCLITWLILNVERALVISDGLALILGGFQLVSRL